jgi:hypothetical protein
MQKKIFLTDSTGYEMQTFLTPLKHHTLVKNMFLHKNPDFTDHTMYSVGYS